MIDKSIKIGDYEVFTIDGKYLSISTGDYEYGCAMKISEWEAIKAAIDKMIAEDESNETNPTATR